jgi:hypothetical protein
VLGTPRSVGRAERAAANESTFRGVNERLEQKAAELSFGEERTPYLCECEDRGCRQVILLTRQEYEAARAQPRTFVVVPGHQSGDERMVEEGARFIIVEKTGEEGKLVEEQDPRS